MRVFRKLVALVLYGALLLPGAESFRITTWLRAVTVTSTAFDSTMRRRRSRLENDRFARDLKLLQRDADHGERTLRVRVREAPVRES
jgi:hypothetical protein